MLSRARGLARTSRATRQYLGVCRFISTVTPLPHDLAPTALLARYHTWLTRMTPAQQRALQDGLWVCTDMINHQHALIRESAGQQWETADYRRRLLRLPADAPHAVVIESYNYFSRCVLPPHLRAQWNTAHRDGTGYDSGRTGRVVHAQFLQRATECCARARAAADDVTRGTASFTSLAYRRRVVGANARATSEDVRTAYSGLIHYAASETRTLLRTYEQQAVAKKSATYHDEVFTQRLARAVQFAERVQEQLAAGGQLALMRDYQRRVLQGSGELDRQWKNFRTQLSPAQRELLDTTTLLATGRPPGVRGRILLRPELRRIDVHLVVQRAQEIAAVVQSTQHRISLTDYWRQLLPVTTLDVVTLDILYGQLLRTMAPDVRFQSEILLARATGLIYINGRYVPIGHLRRDGINGHAAWQLLTTANPIVVTTPALHTLDHFMAAL